MNIFEHKNMELVTEFDRYIHQNPQYAESIPEGALVAMEIEGEEAFNDWSRKIAQQQAEAGQLIVYVRIKKLRPAWSRIEELEITA